MTIYRIFISLMIGTIFFISGACGSGGKSLVYCDAGSCTEVNSEENANFRCDINNGVASNCESLDMVSSVHSTDMIQNTNTEEVVQPKTENDTQVEKNVNQNTDEEK